MHRILTAVLIGLVWWGLSDIRAGADGGGVGLGCNSDCRLRHSFKVCAGGSEGGCLYYEQAVCSGCQNFGACTVADWPDWNTCKQSFSTRYYVSDACVRACACGVGGMLLTEAVQAGMVGDPMSTMRTRCQFSAQYD